MLELFSANNIANNGNGNSTTSHKRDVVDYINAFHQLNELGDSPLVQLLRQNLMTELNLASSYKEPLDQVKANKEEAKDDTVETVVDKARFCNLRERATQLGFKIESINTTIGLGHYVIRKVKPLFQRKIGRWNVWHYEVSEVLDAVIRSYFDK